MKNLRMELERDIGETGTTWGMADEFGINRYS
jgi:hypothetical protein